ncbi:acyl-CoA thioesterase [Ferruginibacter sp.]
MSTFTVKTEIRWADIDPNFHVLHSKYYDYCANARLLILAQYGITMQVLQEEHIGPILFREEAVFKKELKFGDEIEIKIKLLKATEDFSRWSFACEIWKNTDTLAAIVTVDGAWLDTVKRKLAIPSERFKTAFAQMPKAENYNQ